MNLRLTTWVLFWLALASSNLYSPSPLRFASGQFIRPCSVFSWPIICCGDHYCSSPLETATNCPQDCSGFVPPPEEPSGAHVEIVPNLADVNTCVGTTTATLFAQNSWELYVNGFFVKEDPISGAPDQAVSFSFSVNTSAPVQYAVYLTKDVDSSTGLSLVNSNSLGGGGFIGQFSDGTITNSSWKCMVISSGPDPTNCCSNWDGSQTCNSKGSSYCTTTQVSYDSNWYAEDYDFSSWPAANTYTTATTGIGFGNPCSYNISSAQCFEISNPSTSVYTTSQECLSAATQNYGSADFIWSSDPLEDNALLCRYTAPASTSTYDPNLNVSCPVCTTPTATTQRVRKELRKLSQDTWQRVINAIYTMKNLSTDAGQAIYGSNYKEYDYFITKHAITTTDTRGDQGHFSAAFITWHSAFLLEFENCLLAIDPQIGALPYWDSTLTDPSIYSDTYLGSVPGTGSNSQVIDGAFAYFPITKNWTMARYEKYLTGNTVGFNNSELGYLRNYDNTNPNPYLTRFGIQFAYDANDWVTCSTIQGYWSDWFSCIELGNIRGVQVTTSPSFSHHSGAHLLIGASAPGGQGGDFMDVVTSPNEPLFWFHHANMDRSKMWFMQMNFDKENIFYGFPVSNSSSIPEGTVYPGINLNDPMASAWGFTLYQLGLSSTPSNTLATHADMICHLSPHTSPYIYDDMVNCQTTNTCSTSPANRVSSFFTDLL